jgi:hypothetical protein
MPTLIPISARDHGLTAPVPPVDSPKIAAVAFIDAPQIDAAACCAASAAK